MKGKKSILIVDDHQVVREGLKKILEHHGSYHVCGDASGPDEAINIIAEKSPHLVLVDISLGSNATGIDLVKACSDRFPGVKTAVLSMHDEKVYAERALKAGARGYIMKQSSHEVILEAISYILQGNIYLSREMSSHVLNRIYSSSDTSDPLALLSDRELEIFKLIGEGLSTSSIASKLNISTNTLQSHRRRIKEKLSLETSAELTHRAIQWSSIV
jgi:DNA-binding NarL/FixJ family response regulator